VTDEVVVPVSTDADVVAAREKGRELSAQLGFSSIDLTLIVTAISELARNILTYAGEGEIALDREELGDKRGIVVIARDHGPGIADVDLALQDGYSTSRSLGIGLPGVRRLMDEFELSTAPGSGTTVTTKKWC
jgi:serine/threonine-protein kinase RsbT